MGIDYILPEDCEESSYRNHYFNRVNIDYYYVNADLFSSPSLSILIDRANYLATLSSY
jgi:hypothetical protein